MEKYTFKNFLSISQGFKKEGVLFLKLQSMSI